MDNDIVVNMNFNLGKDQTVADIVTLLRKYQPFSKLHGQAADEIERLRKDYDRLSNAAQKLAACISEDSHGYGCLGYKFDGWCTCEVREALKAVRGE